MPGVRVPGKVFVAGEYAVLAGAPAVVLAIDRYLTARAAPAERTRIAALGQSVERAADGRWSSDALPFARTAFDVAAAYGGSAPTASIEIDDELRTPAGDKLGLGGSAATAVAVARLVLGPDATPPAVFQAAATAHRIAQNRKGSGADVLACALGGAQILFRAFDSTALEVLFDAGFAARGGLAIAPGPDHRALPPPAAVLVAYTGAPADTRDLVSRVEAWAAKNPRPFAEFVARTAAEAGSTAEALERGDVGALASAVDRAGNLLDQLGESSGVPIATEAHRRIIAAARAAGCGAKVSGAGGGDSCLVVGEADALDRAAAGLQSLGFAAQRVRPGWPEWWP